VVIVAAVIALRLAAARATRLATGVPVRTIGRWLAWWRGPFTATSVFVALSSRLVPAVSKHALPLCVLERLVGEAIGRVSTLLDSLAPLTTASVPDGSRFVRGATVIS
jgi:hypothetical protein